MKINGKSTKIIENQKKNEGRSSKIVAKNRSPMENQRKPLENHRKSFENHRQSTENHRK